MRVGLGVLLVQIHLRASGRGTKDISHHLFHGAWHTKYAQHAGVLTEGSSNVWQDTGRAVALVGSCEPERVGNGGGQEARVKAAKKQGGISMQSRTFLALWATLVSNTATAAFPAGAGSCMPL